MITFNKSLPLIKIIDWGIATQLKNDFKTKLSEQAGTISYMAPEVLRKNYDYRSDIWSLGIIAYMLLCGEYPFEEILKKVSKSNN